LNNFRVS